MGYPTAVSTVTYTTTRNDIVCQKGVYKIEANGGGGRDATNNSRRYSIGGAGGRVSTYIFARAGDTLNIGIGLGAGAGNSGGGAGGGASNVQWVSADRTTSQWVAIAGGGGGGAGFSTIGDSGLTETSCRGGAGGGTNGENGRRQYSYGGTVGNGAQGAVGGTGGNSGSNFNSSIGYGAGGNGSAGGSNESYGTAGMGGGGGGYAGGGGAKGAANPTYGKAPCSGGGGSSYVMAVSEEVLRDTRTTLSSTNVSGGGSAHNTNGNVIITYYGANTPEPEIIYPTANNCFTIDNKPIFKAMIDDTANYYLEYQIDSTTGNWTIVSSNTVFKISTTLSTGSHTINFRSRNKTTSATVSDTISRPFSILTSGIYTNGVKATATSQNSINSFIGYWKTWFGFTSPNLTTVSANNKINDIITSYVSSLLTNAVTIDPDGRSAATLRNNYFNNISTFQNTKIIEYILNFLKAF